MWTPDELSYPNEVNDTFKIASDLFRIDPSYSIPVCKSLYLDKKSNATVFSSPELAEPLTTALNELTKIGETPVALYSVYS